MLKQYRRVITLIVIFTVCCSVFLAFPTYADEHDSCTDGCISSISYFLLPNSEGELVKSLVMPRTFHTCPNVVIYDYTRDGPHDYMREDHITYLVQYCAGCGWVYEYSANCIGGCGTWCRFPKFPSDPSERSVA